MPSGLFQRLAGPKKRDAAHASASSAAQPAADDAGHDSAGSRPKRLRATLPSSSPECEGRRSSADPDIDERRSLRVRRFLQAEAASASHDEIDAVAAESIDTGGKPRSYWAGIMNLAVADRWEIMASRGGPREPMGLDSGCSNLGSEFLSVMQLQIPTDGMAECSEVDPIARQFLRDNFRHLVSHIWDDMLCHGQGSGRCSSHGMRCEARKDLMLGAPQPWHTRRGRRHCLVLGSPCQPFSKYSGRQGHFSEHDLVETVFGHSFGFGPRTQAEFDSARDLVHRTLPYCVILEEIDEFADVDTKLKKSPARLLLEDFIAIRDPDAVGKQYYTAVRIYQRQASKLAAVSRNRSPS